MLCLVLCGEPQAGSVEARFFRSNLQKTVLVLELVSRAHAELDLKD